LLQCRVDLGLGGEQIEKCEQEVKKNYYREPNPKFIGNISSINRNNADH